jgi:hypothetical protein
LCLSGICRSRSAVVSTRSKQTSPSSQTHEKSNESNDSGTENKCLSAWEQWILKKAMEERNKLELEFEKMRLENEAAERLRREKEEKKMKADKVIQAWVEQHDTMVKQRMQLAAQRRQAEVELKEAKKREIEIKAQEKFKVREISSTSQVTNCLVIRMLDQSSFFGHMWRTVQLILNRSRKFHCSNSCISSYITCFVYWSIHLIVVGLAGNKKG